MCINEYELMFTPKTLRLHWGGILHHYASYDDAVIQLCIIPKQLIRLHVCSEYTGSEAEVRSTEGRAFKFNINMFYCHLVLSVPLGVMGTVRVPYLVFLFFVK